MDNNVTSSKPSSKGSNHYDDHKTTSESDTNDESCYCSFAVTRNIPTFQHIYQCLTCCPDPSLSEEKKKSDNDEDDDSQCEKQRESNNIACICASCAECCHEALNHDVDYIGFGPCYCDCSTELQSCSILKDSMMVAKSCGIEVLSSPMTVDEARTVESSSSASSTNASSSFPFQVSAYSIPKLDRDACERLSLAAQEMVKYTKETHWVPATCLLKQSEEEEKSRTKLCGLERLALSILHRHLTTLNLDEWKNAGAEWWVQVTQPTKNAGIDLHYDKDEALAEKFQLGSFPTISTVTYLTHGSSSSPTVVFPHTYNQIHDEIFDQVILSYPKPGKHLLFDGRLLHGAPSHPALQQSSNDELKKTAYLDDMDDTMRITFLVNIWLHGKPSAILELSSDIRCKLFMLKMDPNNAQELLDNKNDLEMHEYPIPSVSYTIDNLSSLQRIHLPFVSKDATWIDDCDEEEDELMVSMFAPVSLKNMNGNVNDIVCLQFSEYVEAQMERIQQSTTDEAWN